MSEVSMPDQSVIDQYLPEVRRIFDEIVGSDRGKAPQADGELHIYGSVLGYLAVLYVGLDLTFFNPGLATINFKAQGGGLHVGRGFSPGVSILNYRVSEIRNWQARYEFNEIASLTNVNLWGMKGEFIGSFVGAPLGLGLGISGGQGSFHDGLP